MMANITRKPNGTFLIRVSNGMKNGKQDLVSTIYKPPVGSTSAMARKAAEKYAVLFEELVHSGGYEKKQAVSREIRVRRRMTIEQFVRFREILYINHISLFLNLFQNFIQVWNIGTWITEEHTLSTTSCCCFSSVTRTTITIR